MKSNTESTLNRLRTGIERNAFEPYFQPIIESYTGRTLGVELLVRLKENNIIISPDEFIKTAEVSGLIVPITELILDKAIRLLHTLDTNIYLSVNLVSCHLLDHRFYDFLNRYIRNGLIKPNKIKLEITERLPIKNFIVTRRYLNMFYELGVTSVIDDTGMGYGTFLYLNELGARGIKIDKYFINIIDSNMGTQVLDAIINLANNLKLEIIAEGVETVTQQLYLLEHGVYQQQGYLFSRPLNAESFRQAIATSNIKIHNAENNSASQTASFNLLDTKPNTHTSLPA